VPTERRRVFALAVLAACGGASDGGSDARRPAPDSPPVDPSWTLSQPIVFTGACDASGAAGLGGGRIAVADDEDNHLRVYDLAAGGPPVELIDTSAELADERGKHPEMDLEAAATIGSRVYWIGSHSRKKSGKRANSRLRLFATDLVARADGAGQTLKHAGRAYEGLIADLTRLPGPVGKALTDAVARSPIEDGGLNIEGLTDMPGPGHLLLGFRSPVPAGRALLVPVRNPGAMIERGDPADLGGPIELDLGGRGVRAVASWRGAYWIVAGSPRGRAESRLYRWDGSGPPVWLHSVQFGDMNPEALAEASVNGRSGMLVLSDDGERMTAGRPCKRLKDDQAKQFRAVWLEKVQ
jgi:hypothetical protein